MIRVAHLIHTTGIGGVEAAADRIARDIRSIDYRLLAFREDSPAAVKADCVGTGVNSLRSVLTVLRDLDCYKPDVLVTSLWRSVLVGLANRVLPPRTPWAIYLHSTRYTTAADRVAHFVGMRLADRILCDSQAALDALVPESRRTIAEVVSPDSALLHLARNVGKNAAAAAAGAGGADNSTDKVRLVYWGRAVSQKRLDRSVQFLRALNSFAPDRFSLEIISPHTELLDVVLTDAADLRLDVRWLGPGSAREILEQTAGAQFFLQLSAFEGLGMAVREAMALGIVPIVNPVGAIRGYSADGINAIHVRPSDDGEFTREAYESAARRVIALVDGPEYTRISSSARNVVTDDFIADFEHAVHRTAGTAMSPAAGNEVDR